VHDRDEVKKLGGRMIGLEPDSHCTYHHPYGGNPGFWQAHIWGDPISGECITETEALLEGIATLERRAGKGANEAD